MRSLQHIEYMHLMGAQALFRRAQLKALVDIHSSTEGMMGGYLSSEEISIIRGALDLSGKQAAMAMTPLDKVPHSPVKAGCHAVFSTCV